MKTGRRIIMYILWIILGVTLLALNIAEKLDSFWSGMGTSLILISILQLVRLIRLNKDEKYRQTVEVETNDERNRFIRNKAWAWAGYLFILIVSVLVIVLKVVGLDQLSIIASFGVCLMLVLYWGSYLILRKKY